MLKKTCILILLLVVNISHFSFGFALLSHQAIIDTTWKKSIKPLLIKKYPSANETQLNDAYSYLYGGALMPDIGYSPFGSLMFTNLMHYVRTGDFISTILEEAKDINEYAFGLGLLCHYQADKYGHSEGTNLAVPILFPELKKEFGNVVSYEHGRTEHTRVEFGFDVIQTANGNYDLEARQRFVAFKISEPVLERAFKKTYGLELRDVFKSLPLAIKTFRFAVKQLMPELTKNAWRARNAAVLQLNPKADKKSYTSKLERKKYRKEFGRPGLKSIFFSVIIGIVPKLGPTAGLKYKEPDEKVDKIFNNCFKSIVNHYSGSLEKLESDRLKLENINYDTGKKTEPGQYMHADETYFELLKKHEKTDFKNADETLKKDLLVFFSSVEIEQRFLKKKCKMKTMRKALIALKEN